MTERESKEFYDDLRHKLEGYGSAPPESVWAGIRQQVPARPRRWWRGGLLVLLLTALVAYFTVSTRPWRLDSAGKPTTVRPATGAKAPATTATNSPNSITRRHQQGIDNKPIALDNNTLPATSPAVQPGSGATSEAASQAASRLAHGRNSTSAAGSVRIRLNAARQLPATDSTTKHRPQGEAMAAANSGAITTAGIVRSRRTRRAGVPMAVAATSRRYPASRKSTAFPSKNAALRSASTDAVGRSKQEAVRSVSASEQHNSGPTSPPALAASSSDGLFPLLVGLRGPAWPMPPLAYTAIPETQPQPPAKPKWALQVLAGPAVSYRQLGSNARRVEQLERPAAGYGAQLGVARSPNPRLSLSAGISYAEMATGLLLRVRKADSLPPATVRFRDYYRLLTVPVEAQYLLGNSTRWRYGVQGGIAPALLLSARTTEGGACNCQQQQWQPGDSTQRFRRVNLTLTAGAFVRYQAAPGLWLMLRPQAQYFLNSITDPTSGRAARQPWSVGVQGGISFDFPSKH